MKGNNMSALSSVEDWGAAMDDRHQPKGSNTSDHLSRANLQNDKKREEDTTLVWAPV